MKVILTTNIKKLGKAGDQVIVKDGFARNYLLANNMALRDTKSNLEYFEKIKDEIDLKEKEKKQNAINLVEAVKKINIEFIKEADDKDQLYGAVSKKEIINFFNEKEIILLSDDIKIIQPIRTLGEHKIEVNPYEDITAEIKIFVKKT
jgi:large subunit ribosomal protein L9